MALVRRSATTALSAALLAFALVGCAGSGSEQAREENQKMDCLTRCNEELQRKAARPVLVARSQVPAVEVLQPVKLGAPVPSGPPDAPPPLPLMPPAAGDTATIPAEGIRIPDSVPAVRSPVTPVSGTGPTLPLAPAAAPTSPLSTAPAISRFDPDGDCATIGLFP